MPNDFTPTDWLTTAEAAEARVGWPLCRCRETLPRWETGLLR